MLDSIRQTAFLVRDLSEAAELYRKTLGATPSHTGILPQYGLDNMVLPVGDGTFIELLQPTSADSSAARYLERRGESPYMLIFETKRFDELLARLRSLDVRITGEAQEEGSRSMFIHPASVNGALVEIVEVTDSGNPWPAAGPNWQPSAAKPMTKLLRQSAVLVRDLDQATQRWEEMFGLKTTQRFQVSFTDLEIAVIPMEGLNTFIE
ncbi:MAG: VOC family protein, partial [Dehalococcoidia bacterium]